MDSKSKKATNARGSPTTSAVNRSTRGVKRSTLGPRNIRPFVSGFTGGTSLSSPAIVGTRGINEDGINNSNKRIKVKKIVTTVIDGIIQGQVRNVNSAMEELRPNGLGDEAEVNRDDEGSSSLDDSHAEALDDDDVVLRAPARMPGNCKSPRRF